MILDLLHARWMRRLSLAHALKGAASDKAGGGGRAARGLVECPLHALDKRERPPLILRRLFVPIGSTKGERLALFLVLALLAPVKDNAANGDGQ